MRARIELLLHRWDRLSDDKKREDLHAVIQATDRLDALSTSCSSTNRARGDRSAMSRRRCTAALLSGLALDCVGEPEAERRALADNRFKVDPPRRAASSARELQAEARRRAAEILRNIGGGERVTYGLDSDAEQGSCRERPESAYDREH
jgi:hypothetical protein